MSGEQSLAEWLGARLDEDEHAAQAVVNDLGNGVPKGFDVKTLPDSVRWHLLGACTPGHVFDRVAATRRIIAEVVPSIDKMDTQISQEWGGYNEEVGDQLLRLLALPYAGRDGWREEWRPDASG